MLALTLWNTFLLKLTMREIINGLPVDVDALLARLEKKYDDMGMDEGNLAKKKKGRERTVQGALALAELQL